MSDEETMMNGDGATLDEKGQELNSVTSDDDDSFSSNSGSSSDSSDSESNGEDNGTGEGGDARQTQHPDNRDAHFSDRKYSIESVVSSDGLRGDGKNGSGGAAEPLNVNPKRAELIGEAHGARYEEARPPHDRGDPA